MQHFVTYPQRGVCMPSRKLTAAALTIAGSDSCGGAGIQADLKTFAAQGVYGASVITALTAQNTLGVQSISQTPPTMVTAQLRCVLGDLPVRAIKTGMLGSPETIAAVIHGLQDCAATGIPLVMDPVMVATSGAALADDETVAAMRELISQAALVTPNTLELARLTGVAVESIEQMREAGNQLLAWGCRAVLLKGGHLPGGQVTDLLLSSTGEHQWTRPRLSGEFHGTGCTLSAAIAAGLAKGFSLAESADQAIEYLARAMAAGTLPTAGKLLLLDHTV
jgi:hydroxymethylpyrimidine/phosphomethylpyrimidine kinase